MLPKPLSPFQYKFRHRRYRSQHREWVLVLPHAIPSSNRFVDVILYFCLREFKPSCDQRPIHISLLLGILVTWSSAYIDVGVQGCLFQIYPILLSTTLSINRKQLNVFDANFALTISSSPLTLYLVVASIGDILGLKTGLYKRIKRRHFVRPFLVILPFIWLGLSLTLRLSNHAFKGSDLCDGSTLGDWLKDLGLFFTVIYIKFNLMLGGQITAPLITLPIFLLCLFRRRSLVTRDVGVYWKKASNPWRRLLIPLVFVKVAWCVLVDPRSHKLTRSSCIKVYHQTLPRLVHTPSVLLSWLCMGHSSYVFGRACKCRIRVDVWPGMIYLTCLLDIPIFTEQCMNLAVGCVRYNSHCFICVKGYLCHRWNGWTFAFSSVGLGRVQVPRCWHWARTCRPSRSPPPVC